MVKKKDVDVAVCRKWDLFRVWKQSRKDKAREIQHRKGCTENCFNGYELAARQTMEKVDSCHDGHELFRISKQRPGERAILLGVNSLKNEDGVVKVVAID